MPVLQAYCAQRYPQINTEDCLCEANLELIKAIRSWPTDTAHFWRDFYLHCDAYMRSQKEKLTLLLSRRAISLDAPLRRGEGSATLLDYLPAPQDEMIG